MAVSRAYKILWSAAVVSVILPHLNLGLLSDYKICGEAGCESPMSRVQAIRDHHGKDCRFLSFRRGDTIFVYHKLTGMRDDLWAGSIDKQFGYFPKDAVQEEQVHTTMEKVVETQKSDFFCMDEFGYPIDSSHLDNDDDEDAEKFQNQGSETAQTTPNTDDTNAGSPSISEDVSTEPPALAQEADSTLTEEDKSKNTGDVATSEEQEASAASNEQGGSASSPWLGSSVTGWLGLATENKPGNLDGGGEKDESKETQADTSFTTSVTGWLGLGGEGQAGDAQKSGEEDKKTADSFTSSMTEWLGFGGEKETVQSAEKESDDEQKNDEEPEEKFRSRRMSLDLEGSQLHEEEEKEMGTFDWLGNGLSNTMGFGLTNQESEHKTTTVQEKEEHSASSSWFDMGIGNILSFNNKDKGEADESIGSSIKEAKGHETLGPTDSENADTSQPQLVLTEEVNTDGSNESNMEETPEDQNVPSDTQTMPGLKVNEIPTDTYQDFVTQPRINLEPGFSTVDSNSNSIIEAGDIGVMDKTEDIVEQRAEAPNQVDNTEESADLSGTTVASSDGRGDVENNAETDALHREIYTTQTDELASQVSGGAEEISRESPAVLSSSTAEERNEPLSNQEDSFTSESEKNSLDNSDHSQPVESSSAEFGSAHSANINTEIISTNASEEDRGTVFTSESTTQTEDDAHHSSVSTHHHQQSDGDELTETEKDMETEVEEVEEERERGMEYLKEEEKQEEIQEAGEVKIQEKQQEVEKQVEGEEENQTDTEDLKEEERQDELQEAKDIKTQEKQQKVEEEKQDGLEHLKEEEKQKEVKDEMENGKQEEVEEFREAKNEEEIEEFKEEAVEESVEKQGELEEIKEEDKQEEEGMEEGKQAEEEELKVEEKKEREEVEELMGEENQEEVEELKEAEKWEEANELKQEEKQQQIEELEEEKWEDVEELKEEERREVLKEVEKEENEHEEKQAEAPQLQTDVNSPESESNDKEIQHERSSESESESESESTQTEWSEMENAQTEEKEVKDVVKDLEVAENYEFDGMDKEEEENLKCSNELCPYSSVDGFVKDSDDFASSLSSTDEGTIETGEQNPTADNDQKLADLTGGSQSIPSESLEREEDRKQEEQERDAEADEGKVEEGESHQTWKEDVTINNANSIPDNSLKDNQIEEADKNLLHSAKTGHDVILGQTAGNEAGEQTDPSDVNNINLSDDHVIHQEEKAQSEDTENSTIKISTEMRAEQIHSDHKRDTEEDTDWEQRHDDLTVNTDGQMKQRDGSGDGTEFRARGGTEDPVSIRYPVEHQAVLSEHVVPHMSQHLSEGHNGGTAETESEGAFGMFKNAFGYFSKRKESTESDPSLDSNTGEATDDRESVSPEQELDPIQVQDLHTESPIILSQQQQQPTPPPFVQTSSATPLQALSHSNPPSPNTGSPLKTKSLSKHYTNLLAYMNADEMTVSEELFGRHKLQFLDYILGSTETMTDDDESILSDIERLLHHQRETLVAPSLKLTDAPQEDKEKTRTLNALQKLQMLLERVKETFNGGKSDVTNTNHQGLEDNTSKNKWMEVDQQKDGQLNGDAAKKGVILRGEKEIRSPNAQPGPPQSLEGVMKQILDSAHQIAEDSTTHVHAMRELLILVTAEVVSALPDDIRPGPDLYGVPWEPVIVSSLVGLITMLLFTCRCFSSVKSRMYRSKERWMAEQVTLLLDEKCKVLETLSTCQREYDELENSLRDSGALAQTQKTEELEGKARQLGHAKRELERDHEQLRNQLEQQREHRKDQERRIVALKESMKLCEEETKDLQSQDEQAQTTLKVYNMNSDRLQRNLETVREETALLQESNAQLRQQVEGWAERVSELEAEMSRCEVAHGGMLQDVANKDERIMSLTDRLLRMKGWESDLEEEEGEEGGEKETSNGTAGQGEENGRGDKLDTQSHLQKVQKLIYAAKLNADLKSVDEDKDRAFAKLNDEVKAKEDLLVSIKELENEKLSLQSDTEHYSDQVQRLQQKLNIMTEMYQENELKLHRLLTVEERERLQKEEKLNKADKNIALAMEELNNYRQRAEEMEEELEKSRQSYQTQISAHEKKAHNNWLAARAADRELADIRRENALLRQKLTDTQFKLDTLDKDPYALDSLARPLPFRAERSPYGPSPLGRPASETRAFLSPPTLMDGPPARLSPRVPRGPMEPPGGQGEMERIGGPHSDSGSISPTWERDRRGPPPGPPPGPPGPLGPPGYMFPEPGGPMYRRPPPPPGAMGFLPPPGSLPPGPLHPRGLPPGPPHPADMADGTFRENSLGPGEQEHRESGPGDRRSPPEADPRMGGAPPPGPPMGPMDGPFPRRPYGPPPPDFYPPRGPGGPPMMPMWAPPPPGVMFPPRFPPGGPLPPPAPHSHHGPPIRPPLPDGLPPPSMGSLLPQQPLSSPPHGQSPEEHAPSPEDAI